MTQATKPKTKTIKVTVSYLPARHPFREEYGRETTLEEVRTAAMAHFGVQNYTDRDTHEFFLEHDGERIVDYSLTLDDFLGTRRRNVHLDLVEQVTAGGV